MPNAQNQAMMSAIREDLTDVTAVWVVDYRGLTVKEVEGLRRSIRESDAFITGILKGLGFSEDEFSKKINMLSGGQKTRVFLGKLLLSKPNIIMLDEPTNHLDLSSIEWLENYLLNYKGTVIIVSHDRYFLDRIVNKVIDLEACEALVYSCLRQRLP